MNQKLEKIFIARINKFENYIFDKILINPIEFDVYYHKSQVPILFKDRLNVDYSRIRRGDKWGDAWENAWFHLKGEIPESWSGSKVVAKLNFTGEGLIFGEDGPAIYTYQDKKNESGREIKVQCPADPPAFSVLDWQA